MAELDSTPHPYGIVYRVRHRESGKIYIGQTTTSLKKRWLAHQHSDYCVLLHRAIKKYGAIAFDVDFLDAALNKDDLNNKEIFYIQSYQATDKAKGYNLRDGGSFGKHSEESKKKMSVAICKAYLNPEFKAKLSAARVGVKRAPETVAKIAAALTGKKASQEAKKSLSEARKILWADPIASENMRQSSIAARSNQLYIDKVSQNSKDQWSDPEKRRALLEAREKTKQAGNAARIAAWADPVKKAARIEKIRATIAAKKAAQI